MTKTIAYITDIHLDEQYPADLGVDSKKNWEIILSDIESKKIDELIFGGDIGAPSSHKYFFDSLKAPGKDLYITLGNHDSYNNVKKYYTNPMENVNKELFYYTEDHIFKYYFLDSSSGRISFPQLTWLEEELQNSIKKKIIFIHHPVLSINTFLDKEYPLQNRDDIKELLKKYNDDIIIYCGHYHMEYENEEDNIKQFMSPSASYQSIRNENALELETNTFGYRIINFGDDQINSEVILFYK